MSKKIFVIVVSILCFAFHSSYSISDLEAEKYRALDSTIYVNRKLEYKQIIKFIETNFKENHLDQARAIAVWLTLYLTYNPYYFNFDDQLNVKAILKKRESCCNGYSFLFAAMCDSVGIDCERVTGYVKQRGTWVYLNTKGIPPFCGHSWNIIQIKEGNKYRQVLIDVTYMDLDKERKDKEVSKEYQTSQVLKDRMKEMEAEHLLPIGFQNGNLYNDTWFDIDPKFAIYNHYPYAYGLDIELNTSVGTKYKNITQALRNHENIQKGASLVSNCQLVDQPITIEYFFALPLYIDPYDVGKNTSYLYPVLKPFPEKKYWYIK